LKFGNFSNSGCSAALKREEACLFGAFVETVNGWELVLSLFKFPAFGISRGVLPSMFFPWAGATSFIASLGEKFCIGELGGLGLSLRDSVCGLWVAVFT
jgi:hypothetical protein